MFILRLIFIMIGLMFIIFISFSLVTILNEEADRKMSIKMAKTIEHILNYTGGRK